MEKGHDRYPDGAVRRLPIRMEIRTAEVAWIANQARIGVDLLGNLVFSGANGGVRELWIRIAGWICLLTWLN